MYELREYSDVYRNRPVGLSWKVPVFCNNDWVALRVLEYCRQMGVRRPFDLVYGAPLCAWAGGRPSLIRTELSDGQLEAYFKAYAEYGVTVALTMSRLSVDEDRLSDGYCNRILGIAERYHAQAIIADDRLLDHIRSNHGGITTVASLDKVMVELKDDYSTELAYYREILDRFDEVVVRCECALDDARILKLEDVADRIEIIPNQVCMRDCQFCDVHIGSMERLNDTRNPVGQPESCFYLSDAKDTAKWLSDNLTIPESRILSLASRGFTKMKLAGRNSSQPKLLNLFERYIFEPTGVFWHIQNDIAREYNEISERAGRPMPPYLLPESSH